MSAGPSAMELPRLLGRAVARTEDPDLLRGVGRYVDDLAVEGCLYLSFARSHVSHGLIRQVDVSEARLLPGVVDAFVASDLGLPLMSGFASLNEQCGRPPLAIDRVRFVGEAVVAVLAETRAAAEDAIDNVVIDVDPLGAVVDPLAALADDAPLQFETLGSNLAAGERDPACDDRFGDADVVVHAVFQSQRMAVVPIEGNAICVQPQGSGGLLIHVASQMPHNFRRQVCELLELDEASVRVVAPNVGGGFGSKAAAVPEHLVAIAVARRVGRPVKWVESRSENLVSMPHARRQVQYVRIGAKRDGSLVGMDARVIADCGAYAGFGGAVVMGATRSMAQGVYDLDFLGFDVACAMRNTTPMGALRGAGRPEATALVERAVDIVAVELGIDPVELRRRNMVRRDEFPFTTKTGMTYDSGDYHRALDAAVGLAGYDALRAEQARRRAAGERRQLGIGVCTYVEVTARNLRTEYARAAVQEDGSIVVAAGTSPHGQGHATAYAMLTAERFGLPMERVRVVQNDTSTVPRGGGTGGSRSLQLGGSAILGAADVVIERARELAAQMLEAAVEDVVVMPDVGLGVAGVPGSAVTWGELARAAAGDGDPLEAEFDFVQDSGSFPFGAHIAVVEVDVETGAVELTRHVAVDDCGTIINPLIVAGQQHGGIAHGAAQALFEQFVYDDDGNPLTTTLAEYGVPSAAEMPSFEVANTVTESPLNPLGAKGIGESGTAGSVAAVQNAVVDALSHLGVRHIDMPCSPERVWRAIDAARRGDTGVHWTEPPAIFERLPVRRPVPTAELDVDL